MDQNHIVATLFMKSVWVVAVYTGCNRRNGPDFGRVFLMLYYTDITQVTLMKSTDINITETTYSCQFQYEFGNQ